MTRIKRFAIIECGSLTKEKTKTKKHQKKGKDVIKRTRPLWEVFPALTNKVHDDHIEREAIGGGHNFLHALMVAQYGEMIVEGRLKEYIWIAGIIHNTDRLFPRETEKTLYGYLNKVNLPPAKKDMIIEAVLKHSKLPEPDDNTVTVALMDADKLANIGPNIAIRSGQFYHNLPDFDPRYLEQPDPTSNYRNPKTVLRDIMFSLEWEGKAPNGIDWIRLPKAKKLAKPWFKLLRAYIEGFTKQLKEVGLLPYPFAEHYVSLNQK